RRRARRDRRPAVRPRLDLARDAAGGAGAGADDGGARSHDPEGVGQAHILRLRQSLPRGARQVAPDRRPRRQAAGGPAAEVDYQVGRGGLEGPLRPPALPHSTAPRCPWPGRWYVCTSSARLPASNPHEVSMRRIGLAVVLVSLVLAPLAAGAQQTAKVYRIGVLGTRSATLNTANLGAFRQGLRELGYVEGRDFVIEYRWADGRPERFSGLATELVRLKVDLLVTRGTPAALAAAKATESIPIVMASSGDPTGFGIVSRLARPGGNVTGLSTIAVELAGKRLGLLTEAIPSVTRLCRR